MHSQSTQSNSDHEEFHSWCDRQARSRWVNELGLAPEALSEDARWDEGTFFPSGYSPAPDNGNGLPLLEIEGHGGVTDDARVIILERAIQGLPTTGIRHYHATDGRCDHYVWAEVNSPVGERFVVSVRG